MSPSWSTSTDWDNAQSETGVHHEQPANTDWAAADTVEKGYPTSDEGGTALEWYVTLDEDSGSTAHDQSGNNYDCNIIGTTINQTPAPFGNTFFSFDGTDDRIRRGTRDFYNIASTEAVSWSFWIRPDSASSGDYSEYIINHDANLGDGVSIAYDSNDSVGMITVGGNTQGTGSSINDGAWHHIGLVLDQPNDTYTLYIDGVQDYQDTSYSDNIADQSDTLIQAGYNGSTTGCFGGDLSDIRFYSRGLSASEIAALYNAAV